MEEIIGQNTTPKHIQEKVIVYALGEYWRNNLEKINILYDVVACSDQNEEAAKYSGNIPFVDPSRISDISYDKIIIGCKARGIRELLITKYGLPSQKIFYGDEISKDSIQGTERIPKVKKHDEHLTVVIPTYNRKQRLQRTMDILNLQSDKDFDIIILDNCSNYNVDELFTQEEYDFKNNVTVIHNKANIGMAANLANAFIQKTEGWVWMLSDDDIPSIYAVEDIYEEIEQCSYVGAIHFSICDLSMRVRNGSEEFCSLHELMSFYGKIILDGQDEGACSGDFIYFSNKVYNMRYIHKYCEKIFFYAYSGVPQLVPILFMLNECSARYRISNKKIIAYDAPQGDHWDWIKTMLGMRIITDFPISLDKTDRKILYRLIMFEYIDRLISNVNENNMEHDIRQIEKIYDEVYQYTLSDEEREKYQFKIKELKDRIKAE